MLVKKKDLYIFWIFLLFAYSISLVYKYWDDREYLSTTTTTYQLTILTLAVVVLTMVAWVRSGNRFVSLFTIFYLYMFFSNVGQQIALFFPSALYTGASILLRFRGYEINQWLLFSLAGFAATGLGAVFISRWYTNRHDFIVNESDIQPIYLGKQTELLIA